MLLEDAATEAPQSVAPACSRPCDRPFSIQGKQVQMRASIGVALDTPTRVDPAELLRERRHRDVRGQAAWQGSLELFEERMHAEAVRRLDLEAALERAIANEALEVHYQPIVELRDGAVVGFEALLRWRDAERQFIPCRSHQARRGDRTDRADRPLRAPRGLPPGAGAVGPAAPSTSPSTSPPRSWRGAVLATCGRAARERPDPRALVIEITESAIIDDSRPRCGEPRQLRKLGVRLRSTTSAPATRRWPGCAASRSTS